MAVLTRNPIPDIDNPPPALDICHKHFLRLKRFYAVAKWYKNTICGIRIPYGKYPETSLDYCIDTHFNDI